VACWVEGGGGGADRDGLAGADFSGDDADGVLVYTPADPGDGLRRVRVAVQYGWDQAATEWHSGKSVILLQPFNTHADTPSLSMRLMSSILSCPGIWPPVVGLSCGPNRQS
jgi:hypothetical protein